MDRVVRQQFPVIVGATVLGVLTGCICMLCIRNAAGSVSASMFSLLALLAPCVIMFVVTFIVTATATEIGQSLHITMVVICLVAGVVATLVASAWMSDADIAAKLLANSPEGTTITPILQSPITLLRNVAAFVVVPTVGCILGAWVGSRLHPMKAEKPKGGKKKSKR